MKFLVLSVKAPQGITKLPGDPTLGPLWGSADGDTTLRREIRGLAFNTYTERAKHKKCFLKGM